MRAGLPLAVLALCGTALAERLGGMTLADVSLQFAAIRPGAWLGAAALMLVSFWAVGRYDSVAHRHLATGIGDRQARITGTIAIALAQTLGFGIATGALARWRMLPTLSAKMALTLSTFVAVSFMSSMALVTALAVLFLPGQGWAFWPALAVLALVPAIAWLLFRHPAPRILGRRVHLPTLPACIAIAGWTALDVAAAGLALYLLVPATVEPGFAAFLPVFLMATGAALLSGTPGGVGPFELVMLGLLPQVPQAELVGALVAFRGLYYALPALLAAAALIRPFGRPAHRPAVPHPVPDPAGYPRAELGLLRQNGGRWLFPEGGAIAVWPTAQALTGLLDPLGHDPARALSALRRQARRENKVACLYKSSARIACLARRLGWPVLHMADEAVLDPQRFELDAPARRTLRRKRKAAEKAGIGIEAPRTLPWQEMARIDAEWQAMRGPARGGTMGRFSPAYLEWQHVVVAYAGGRPVAFASFHVSGHEWCLDLMRSGAGCPDGTMHALVLHAIEAARASGIRRFSLAAVPACPDPHSPAFRALARFVAARAGGPGLRQFKSAFAPRWQPLYMAAPSRAALILAAADIARSVTRPPPVEDDSLHPAHNQDENYEFASRRTS